MKKPTAPDAARAGPRVGSTLDAPDAEEGFLPLSPIPDATPECLDALEYEVLVQHGRVPLRASRRKHVATCAQCGPFVMQFATDEEVALLHQFGDGLWMTPMETTPVAAAELADVDNPGYLSTILPLAKKSQAAG
ncbi:MAG: hypothetical protein ACT4P6_09820 [Gemmatimonadaceae bacterium]